MNAPDTRAPRRRLLVSGANGFIGGKLAPAAVERGFLVRALVRRKQGVAEQTGVELFVGDLLEPESLAGIADGVDVVVHCAGILGKWGTPEERIREVNVQGTLNLLRCFRGREQSRFIHLSAGGVTGPLPVRQVDEGYPCRPATPYERTKLLGERIILEQFRELGVPASVVRPTFTYGPGDPHKLALFRAVKRGRYAFIGDGRSVVHPVFIEDLISGIFLAIEHARPGEVYIIGGERPVTKRELVFAIADALGVRRPFARIPLWVAGPTAQLLEALGRAAGFEPILTRSRVMMMADNFGYSIDKARAELGYEPQIDLVEGIRRTVAGYREGGLV